MFPDIVLGPPGTGKTTNLLARVEESLARGVPPDRIGYVSFTKRAAQEAVERAVEKFKLEKTELRYFRTLHSMCFNALGLSNGDVFEGKKVLEFGRWIGMQMSEAKFSDDGLLVGFTVGDRAMFMENLARVRCVELRDQYELNNDGLPWSMVAHVARGLAQYKQDKHLLDYTDMLDHFVRTEWSPNLEELYVDESQDLSALQWQVVRKLARTCKKVVVAGDDDQAIYKWAGADVDNFVDMEGAPSVLGKSWRCPPEIQKISEKVIGRVSHRRPKQWSAREGTGQVDRVMDFSEVDLWGKDVLVLARNAFVLRDLFEPIRSDGIIYEWKGHTSVSRPILEAVRSWEKLRQGGSVTSDEARQVYDWMASGVGVARGFKQLPGVPPDQLVDMAWLKNGGGLMVDSIWHEALTRIPQEERVYLTRARQKGETTTGKPRVRLSTIHGAKGGQAEHVVLLTDMANRTYGEMQEFPEDEARVWYVAVTRTIEHLTIVAPQTNMYYDL